MDTVQQDLGRSSLYSPSTLPPHAAIPTPVPAANLTYAYAGFGAILGILFGVATAATLHQGGQVAQTKTIVEPSIVLPQQEAGVVHAGFVAPEDKDMGSVSSRASGLRGHLTTSWSEKLAYHFVVEPSDPSQNEAFAQTVNDPPSPLWIDLQLKSAAGAVLCDQEVVLKYDPRKAIAEDSARLNRLVAVEQKREQSNDVFQNDMDKDGKVKSISSQGMLPCTKEQYDNTAFWSFGAQFPSLADQAKQIRHSAAAPKLEMAKNTAPAERPLSESPVSHAATSHLAVGEPVVKAPVTPKVLAVARELAMPKPAPASSLPAAPAAAQATAEVQQAVAFHFEIEGDDAIVDFDAGQKSLETSAGKVFYVNETLVASSVAGWLDEQANIHYRCDETSSCTLSLASASTVLHATMGRHHSSLAQMDAPALTLAQDSTSGPVGLESLGR